MDTQKLIRKNKKIKMLEDENKRLKALIKTHFDSSEQLRLDTFNTVEALKSEFHFLRDELIIADKGSKLAADRKSGTRTYFK